MKCQICGEREASIHYLEIVEGQKTSQWICVPCAEKEGITPTEVNQLAHGGLESFLSGMLTSGGSEPSVEKQQTVPVCDVCGYGLDDLQEKGKLGCPACYTAFRRQLLPMLQRYHGGVSHLGKLPPSHGPRTALRNEIARMKLQLEQCVAQETYEEAARIRDEIRQKERQLEQLDDGQARPEAADDAGPGGREKE